VCSLLELPFAELPAYIQQVWPHIYDMALHLLERFEYAEQLWLEEEEDDDDDDDEEGEGDGDDDDEGEGDDDDEEEIDDDADYDDDDGDDLADLETLRMLGEAADDDEVDGGDHSAYPTAWDMQEIDAVVAFAQLIQGERLHVSDCT
jgi:hypothetical protein